MSSSSIYLYTETLFISVPRKNLFRRKEFKLFQGDRLLVKQIPSNPPYCINATYTNKTILNDVNSLGSVKYVLNRL